MAKHRSSVFTVVREEYKEPSVDLPVLYRSWQFSAIVGTYLSLQRAEEVAGASAQAFADAGVPTGTYRFSTLINTYYDE
jgi:hypothetical protein